MNRVVLIGNGFDLAHGLETSYNDFMLWYLKNCFVECFNKGRYNDALIEIRWNNHFTGLISYTHEVPQIVENFYEKGFEFLFNQVQNIRNWDNVYANDRPFNVIVNSSLLKVLLNNCSYTKWVDIEGEFYSQLKSILQIQLGFDEKEKLLINLNNSLKFVIAQLEIYLSTLPKSDFIEGYMNIFTSNILNADLYRVPLIPEEVPNEIYFVNFNYTNTMDLYLSRFFNYTGKLKPIVNYIHGQINNAENPLVFGFGDELDEAYLQMEKQKAKGYFDFIKSFWYFRTSNYRNLVSVISGLEYEVYILGHSCGLSDRTMLHMLFEHPNCKSIKVYYHGTKEKNNFTNITHEIARHFKNKEEMRNKIVSFDRCSPMPQSQQ